MLLGMLVRELKPRRRPRSTKPVWPLVSVTVTYKGKRVI